MDMKKILVYFFTIINVVLYFVVIGTWIVLSNYLTLNVSVTIFNIALTIVLIILNKDKLDRYYSSSQFKNLVSSLVSVLLLFFILGIVNFWVFKHPVNFDFTLDKKNTLTPESIKVLNGIDEDIEFIIFAQKNNFLVITTLLDLYHFEKSNIIIKKVDVDLHPELLKQYNVERSGVVIVKLNSGVKKVITLNELNITNALIKLNRSDIPVVLYTIDHGEIDFEIKNGHGGSYLRDLLVKSNISLSEISLSTSDIPLDVDALMILGPKNSFYPNEIMRIKKYLNGGGRVLLLLDPVLDEDKFKDLKDLVREYGIDVKNNFVIDNINYIDGSGGTVPLIKSFNKEHEISRDFAYSVFFPLVSELGLTIDAFMIAQSTTFPGSFSENSSNEVLTQKYKFTEGKDTKGPIIVVAGVETDMSSEESKIRTSRLVVYGNSTFIHNSYAKFNSNFLLFLRSLHWLVDIDGIKSFNLAIGKIGPVFIGATALGVIFYFSVIFIPLLLFVISIVVYNRGKSK